MQVSSVNLQKTVFSNYTKRVTPPTISPKNVSKLGICTATISGIYITRKAKKDYEKLKETGLTHSTISKILRAKDRDGKPVFDKTGINILVDIAQEKDKTFFNHIIKNIDSIDKIKKFDDKENNHVTYEMHSKTPDGDTNASMSISEESKNVFISTRSGLNRKTFSKEILKNVTIDTIETKEKGKTTSIEKIIYDQERNLIIRRQIDPEDKKTVKSYTQITLSPKGDIKDTVKVTYSQENGSTIGTALSNNYKNNSIINAVVGDSHTVMYSQTKTQINPLTGRTETINMTPSDVIGIYNSTITDDLGNIKVESKGDKDFNGNTIVEKHFESFDGTKTDYSYSASKNENNIKMSYVITSKDGQVLTNITRTFDRINSNLAYSSVNGKEYVIEKTNNSIIITDKNNRNKKTKIKFADLCYNKETLDHIEIVDKMSGDMLLDFYNRGYRLEYVDENRKSAIQEKSFYIKAKDDIFIFNHELGHAKDFKTIKDEDYDITKKSSVRQKRITPLVTKTFKEELKAFEENSSFIEKEYVSYLTDKMNFMEKNGHISEAVAETNALFSTAPGATYEGNFARDYYFQKYFPRTIAEISKLL